MFKKIGIWGFGVVGKAALAHFKNNSTVTVYDKRALTPEENDLVSHAGATFHQTDSGAEIFSSNDLVLTSPGIDVSSYGSTEKLISELDLFGSKWHKPIIAITGTVGKTSVTHLLSELLKRAGKNPATGGNIGTGMLDLIAYQKTADCAVLEVSSFQLEHTRTCNVDLAILTNLYPNHLDRHKTMDQYFQAKAKLFTMQPESAHAIVPFELFKRITSLPSSSERQWTWFLDREPAPAELLTIGSNDSIFYVHESCIYYIAYNQKIKIHQISGPSVTYPINWVILAAALYHLELPFEMLDTIHALHLPQHRLARTAEHNGITFYNDSKSTLIESTHAALAACSKPAHLFLGGLSKGVDRSSKIADLASHITIVYCFGAEADTLYQACRQYNIAAEKHATLESAFASCLQKATAGDIVLFSPAGSSFDLYADYKARGAHFEQLVKDWIMKN